MRTRLLVLLVIPFATLFAFAHNPGQPLKPGAFNLFSKEQDIQLGNEAAAQVRKQYKTLDNKAIQDYVAKIGNRLAATSEARASGFPFTFTVIVDPTLNAFALPGGPMFINTGLFPPLDNEAQLASVMAHEMSHVILRHGTHEATKGQGLSVLAALGKGAAGNSTFGQLLGAGVGAGANAWMLRFSRDAESEADALGSHLMAEAGWDPAQMAVFFDKLTREGGARPPQLLSDHPNPENRAAAINA
jgi:predicted Zn-dependent protease